LETIRLARLRGYAPSRPRPGESEDRAKPRIGKVGTACALSTNASRPGAIFSPNRAGGLRTGCSGPVNHRESTAAVMRRSVAERAISRPSA
jgi:hypothetical protein